MSDPLAALAAALQDRYTLDRQAGEGGMATVYQATDLKHHRKVALKVLKPELAATIGAERFLREIELAAGLQHPHIVPVYDSGAAAGALYYVMPFVEGESLRDRLERDGRLSLEEAVRLTREAASALTYAHQHGIVHRDIKPENILLSGGHAVVADFGIARAADPSRPVTPSRPQLTGVGLAVGTPAYMSPEQATASDEVDARADEYSLACVFYEMVTGQQPFTGPTLQSVISRSITGPRPRIAALRPDLAPPSVMAAVDGVTQKALAAEAVGRYATVADFAAALGRSAVGPTQTAVSRWMWFAAAVLLILVGGGSWYAGRSNRTVRPGAERIAVLPFAVTGGGDQLLGEGMVDLLSTNLNAVGGIRTVDPRAVLFQVKKRGGPLAVDLDGALTVAKALNAGAVLLGSVVNAGPQVRLSAQLYDRNGVALGEAAQVNGPGDSVLSLVDSLSVRLVRDIWLSREPIPSIRVSALTTGSIAAMRDYLAGEQFYRRSQWDSAQVAFTHAVGADSTFALAQYRLAMTYGWTGGFGQPQADTAIAVAQRYAGRLPRREQVLLSAYQLFEQRDPRAADTLNAYLARHPDDADAWYQLGEVQFHGSDLDPKSPAKLEAPFERVIALDPSLTPALIHPIQLAFGNRDTASFARYLRLLRAGGATDEANAYASGEDFLSGKRIADTTLTTLFKQHPDVAIYTLYSPYADSNVTGDSVLTTMDRVPNPSLPGTLQWAEFELGRATIEMGLGRIAAGRARGEAIKDPPQYVLLASLLPTVYGIAPERDLAPAIRVLTARLHPTSVDAFLKAVMMLQYGRTAEAKQVIEGEMAHDTLARDTTLATRMRRTLRPLFGALDGWVHIQDGDTAGGLRRIESGVQANRFESPLFLDPVRFEYALTLASRPATRDRGISFLQYGFPPQSGVIYPSAFLALGRTAEAAGNRVLAQEAYGRFIRLWDHPDAAVQPRVQEARDALRRLAGEGGT